jgi:hypothetical protein
MTPIREAVLSAYAAGLSVLPPREDGSKAPSGKAWRQYEKERATPDTLRQWYGPYTGLGTVCGAVSGNLEVLDFDTRDVYQRFVQLAHEHGLAHLVVKIESGYVEDTPSGGVHWLYRCSTIGGNTKLARRLKLPEEQADPSDKIKTLIETKGEGGYIVLAPSNGKVHHTGLPYQLRAGSFATIATLEPDERNDLLTLARSLDEMPLESVNEPPTPSGTPTGNRPGDDYNAHTTWADVLVPAGWVEVGMSDGVTTWRRPGKTIGISATTNFGGSDLLVVFSTSTPFEIERGYSRFSAFAILNHGGDFKAAAIALAAKGYGASESGAKHMELICAAEVEMVKLKWMYYARLAYGAITLVEGGPEQGKSTILCDFAARASLGHSFPGETETREPANVVMLIAEDDIATTVVPRLMAAGADLKRIFFLGATRDDQGHVVPFHMSDDSERLRVECEKVEAKFIIVDPLVSFMGSRKGRVLNTNNDLEVRKSLDPLQKLATRLQASVAAIRHYRKGNGTDALEAGGGSVGFAALVRVIIAALPDPMSRDNNDYLLAVAKNNLVAKNKRPAFAYRVVPWADDPDIGRIAWGKTVEMSANEILYKQVEKKKSDRGKAAQAAAFLEQFLASGEWVLTKDILKTAKEMHGLSEDAVRGGKDRVPSIVAEKRGVQWGWILTKKEDSEL